MVWQMGSAYVHLGCPMTEPIKVDGVVLAQSARTPFPAGASRITKVHNGEASRLSISS
jgi:hypothetical protein